MNCLRTDNWHSAIRGYFTRLICMCFKVSARTTIAKRRPIYGGSQQGLGDIATVQSALKSRRTYEVLRSGRRFQTFSGLEFLSTFEHGKGHGKAWWSQLLSLRSHTRKFKAAEKGAPTNQIIWTIRVLDAPNDWKSRNRYRNYTYKRSNYAFSKKNLNHSQNLEGLIIGSIIVAKLGRLGIVQTQLGLEEFADWRKIWKVVKKGLVNTEIYISRIPRDCKFSVPIVSGYFQWFLTTPLPMHQKACVFENENKNKNEHRFPVLHSMRVNPWSNACREAGPLCWARKYCTTAGFNQRAPGSEENLLNSETLSRSKVKMTKKV